ncbi:ABC transporter substrate-binding protein [Methanocorpusculum sp. MG]|uniref:ABC transporter substrate-binding protein n=1 Tax=Methanocorpusculum petauri TaxID=3002863 RepID=A0ABT4IIB7_9EURY|nr:ABC transporter substrate-binding protein [Methanocorpusculum petauri]MCZ0861489.1 ABC transporter substrate-binding protein [Methanocorpusculum petauri]
MSDNHDHSPRTKWTTLIDVLIVAAVCVLFVVAFHPFGTQLSEPFPEDEVVIAAILPMEGSLANFGIGYNLGMEMATRDINAAGGIRGVPLRIEYFDDKSDPDMSVKAMNAVRDAGIPVVIGAIGSENSLAIAPYAETFDIVMLSPASTTGALSLYPGVYRTVASDVYQGGGMAKIVGGIEDVDSVVVVYLDNQYGLSLMHSFEHEIENYLIDVENITEIEIPDDLPMNVTWVVETMAEEDPDVVILIVYPEQGVEIMRAAEAAGLAPIWFGSDTMTSSDVPAQVGTYAENMIGFTQAHKLTVPSFADRYYEEYNTTSINFPVSYGYDAVVLLATCIEDGGYTYAGIRNSLDHIRHVGICGPRVFDENGDVQPAYDLVILENGTWQTLKWNEILTYDYHGISSTPE